MSSYLTRQVAPLRCDERGQLGIAMVLVLPVVFTFFALAFDAGLWYFDHRTAQNQADAAVLAAVQFLPVSATDPNDPQYLLAVDEVNKFLTKNGSDPALELNCGASGRPSPEFMDIHPSVVGVFIDYTFQVKAKLPQLKKAGKKGKKS